MNRNIYKLLSVIVLFSVVSLFSSQMNAQTALKDFVKKLDKSAVTFDFSATVKKSVPVKVGGNVLFQGESYKISQNDGVTIYCNGEDTWMTDSSAKEVIIEKLSGDRDFMNPVLYLSDYQSFFNETYSGNSDFRGKQSSLYVLTSKKESLVKQIKLYFNKTQLIGMHLYTKDGDMDMSVSNLKFIPLRPSSDFVFDTSKLSKDWIITDLR